MLSEFFYLLKCCFVGNHAYWCDGTSLPDRGQAKRASCDNVPKAALAGSGIGGRDGGGVGAHHAK